MLLFAFRYHKPAYGVPTSTPEDICTIVPPPLAKPLLNVNENIHTNRPSGASMRPMSKKISTENLREISKRIENQLGKL